MPGRPTNRRDIAPEARLLAVTRRHFFRDCGVGGGKKG